VGRPVRLFLQGPRVVPRRSTRSQHGEYAFHFSSTFHTSAQPQVQETERAPTSPRDLLPERCEQIDPGSTPCGTYAAMSAATIRMTLTLAKMSASGGLTL
jgi:hypothetical protein